MAGRQVHADRHRAPTASGNTVAITTQIQGVVNSVDLTQSPPLLSIDGQTYTVNQIKSIVQLTVRRSGPHRHSASRFDAKLRSPASSRAPGRSALPVIFKEIRIEALGLGKF